MKTRHLLATLALACAANLPLVAAAQSGVTVTGEVLETQNAAGYTYLRLKTSAGETWAAVTSAEVKKGAQVTIGNASTMVNFESKTLKRRFDKIVFGSIVPAGARPVPAATGGLPSAMHGAAGPGAAAAPHAMLANPTGAAPAPAFPPTPVAKAKGPEARTVAEVVRGKTGLKGKTVLIRARVVKVNAGIKGKNWLHLQDGSGAAKDGSNDLIVTTTDLAAVGDIVTARGTVRTDVTVGPGYAYAVLVEEAAVKK